MTARLEILTSGGGSEKPFPPLNGGISVKTEICRALRPQGIFPFPPPEKAVRRVGILSLRNRVPFLRFGHGDPRVRRIRSPEVHGKTHPGRKPEGNRRRGVFLFLLPSHPSLFPRQARGLSARPDSGGDRRGGRIPFSERRSARPQGPSGRRKPSVLPRPRRQPRPSGRGRKGFSPSLPPSFSPLRGKKTKTDAGKDPSFLRDAGKKERRRKRGIAVCASVPFGEPERSAPPHISPKNDKIADKRLIGNFIISKNQKSNPTEESIFFVFSRSSLVMRALRASSFIPLFAPPEKRRENHLLAS